MNFTRQRTRIWWGGLAAGIVSVGSAVLSSGASLPAVPVTTAAAAKHTIEETLELTGNVEALNSVTVYSKVSGIIEKLAVERGMKVKRGDVIAVVEHRAETARRGRLAAAVKVAEASLAQAVAQRENAELEKRRAENLYREKSIPKQKYDAVLASYKVAAAGEKLAEANLVAARKALEEMDVRLSDYTIRAPIAGVVSERFVDEGAMDTPTMPIVSILDTSMLKITCDVAQVNAARVRAGQAARITTDAYPGYTFTGTVSIVNPALDPASRTRQVEIRTSGEPEEGVAAGGVLLRPGMFVKLNIGTGKRNVLAVPRDCLMRLPGTGVYYLFTVKDGTAQKRVVELGTSRGNLVEIVRGIKVGERVVIKGQVNLKTGTRVVETE